LVWVPRGASISSSTREFVAIYAVAAPGGAMLTTHILLENSGRAVWALTRSPPRRSESSPALPEPSVTED
jgi:hypothetical protein